MIVSDKIYRMSPEYQIAYEKGYIDARNEILEIWKKQIENSQQVVIKLTNKTIFNETSGTNESK